MNALIYWRPTLTPVANAYHLNPYLVEAVVWVESRGRADTFHHDPKVWMRGLCKHPDYRGANPHRVSSAYGLMQVPYPSAREMGFRGEPEELFQPVTNLHWGCKKLGELADWAAGFPVKVPGERLEGVLAAYKGGRGGNTPGGELRPDNRRYAERVLATMGQLQEI